MRHAILKQFTDACLGAAPSLHDWGVRLCETAEPVFERSGGRGVWLTLSTAERERAHRGEDEVVSIGVGACGFLGEIGRAGFGAPFGEMLKSAFQPFRVTRLSRLLAQPSMRTVPGWSELPHVGPYCDAIGLDLTTAGFCLIGSLLPHEGARERVRDLQLVRRLILRTLPARLATVTPDDADAVIAPDGRVLHAPGLGRDAGAILSTAVRLLERARVDTRATDEGERLWDELLAGRWSVVEHLDRDGKRTLLLSRSRAGGSMLTPAERDLLRRVARGQALKQIAGELEVSLSTASERITRALAKLGFRSRADFLRYAPRLDA